MQGARRLLVALVATVALVSLMPMSSAHALSGTKPWVIVLCKFTDRTTEPNPPSYFAELFSDAGASKLGMLNYWKDISYNNLSISGTVVKGWYTLPMTRYQWAGLNRYDKIKTCGNAAAGDVNFANYYGVLAVFNDDSAPLVRTTTLAGAITTGATTMTVNSSTGFPTPPFAVNIDDGTANNGEEVNVTAVSGNTWTITRAYETGNPPTAKAHNNGANVSLIDGGDLGAAATGQTGITLGANNYNLAVVVLPPQTNGIATAHEMGHGHGYQHSRAFSLSTTDYQDCYDIMSGDACRNSTSSLYVFQGDFGAAGVLNDPTPAASGPGADAIDLDIQGWMPSGRTYSFDNSSCNQTTRTSAALNHPEVGGDMEMRIPASMTIPTPNSTTTGTDYYTVESRDKSFWDRGIPQNAVLVHVHGTDGRSYWMDAAGHQGALYAGDVFVDAAHKTYIAVNRIDAAAHTAQVTLGGCKLDATLTYSGDTTGDFNDPVTLAADLKATGSTAPVPNAPLTLTMGTQSCAATTDADGHASCSITIDQHPGAKTAGASYGGDTAYNSTTASTSFTVTKEESAVVYTGPAAEDYHDPFTASGTLTDPDGGAPIAGKTLTFTLGVGDSCSATTDASGSASCSITPTQPAGNVSIVTSFAGDTDYVAASDSDPFEIRHEETTTTYTGPTVILQGASGATLQAQLLEDGTAAAPIAGRTLTLSLGAQSCTGTTDASGTASCTVVPSGTLGSQPLAASFAGDAYYLSSSDTGKTAIVFAFPSRGAFAIGDDSASSAGTTAPVTWWGSLWSPANSLSGGLAPTAFKGYATAIDRLPTTSPPSSCHGTWTAASGDSGRPPATVPSYMGTLVTSHVSKTGSTISGDFQKIVVVRTDDGYAGNPGHPGTGTIVATFCP